MSTVEAPIAIATPAADLIVPTVQAEAPTPVGKDVDATEAATPVAPAIKRSPFSDLKNRIFAPKVSQCSSLSRAGKDWYYSSRVYRVQDCSYYRALGGNSIFFCCYHFLATKNRSFYSLATEL